jgi:very-short-patch-repair endonuclease
VDGYRYHSAPAAFRRDSVRQNVLVAAGYTVLRFTATQAMHDMSSVVAPDRRGDPRLAERRRSGNS